MKLKNTSSYRIYWLLREYGSFGKRIMALDELKAILGLRPLEYLLGPDAGASPRRAGRTRPTLYLRNAEQGPTGHSHRVLFQAYWGREFQKPIADCPAAGMEKRSVDDGVSASGLPAIATWLAAGDYDLGHVRYVLDQVKGQVKASKVKKEGNSVYKALTYNYLFTGYEQVCQASPTSRARVSSTITRQLKKLLSELADARNSLQFV
jgi:hypothetical protein